MLKYLIVFFLFFSHAAFSATECLIVQDMKSGQYLKKEGKCNTRFTPASTFKIPLSLMGFDSHIFTSKDTPSWPYKEQYAAYAHGPPCKIAQIPLSWMQNSCAWYSQALVKKLGRKKFQYYVDEFNYGNKDISGDPGENNGLMRAWLTSSLTISPEEQVVFIGKLLQNQLPISTKAQALTREILFAEELPNHWKMYGKTGSAWQRKDDGTLNSKRHIGWYVGWANKGNDNLIFAYLIKDEQDQTESAGLRAKRAVKNELSILTK